MMWAIWMCWIYVMANGRKTKKPISAYGIPTGTDDAHAHTWVSYEEAKAAAEKNGYDGVGFIIPEGYFFLDLDHVLLEDPFVQLMLERFHSYAEKSVSGEGLHIYGRCDRGQIPTYMDSKGKDRLAKEFYTKNPNNGMELYIGGVTNRFAVYTGNTVMDEPLCDCTQAVLTTLDKNMRRKPKSS
ncbi:MAG: hypothetical protein LUH07_07170, partial [Lachnospiraceae bacterium]|nr:hypothetical protein [Lachnospiraceae bacterium]